MPMEQEKTSNPARRGQVDRDHAGHRPTDRGQVDRGQVGVIVLIVLAVIATVVMLLSNSEVALRLALLASLWSAVIGFFLVTRYRRQAESAEQRVADHERFVREQQESARAAGTGAGVPAQQVLADGGSNGIDPERFEEMWESIRAELSVIRTHLEELQDREFGYEPAALQAEARRIQELEQHTAQAGFSAGFGASSGAPSRDAIDGKLGSQPSQPQPNPLSALISEREQEKQSQRAEYKPAETVKAEPAAAKAAAPKSAQPKPSASTTAATKSESAPAAKPTAAQPAAAQKTTAQNTTAQNTTVQNRSAQNRTTQAAAEPRQRSKDPVFDTSRFHAVRWDSVGETSKKPSTSENQQPASASESSAAAEVSASSNRLRPYNASAQGSGSHAAPQEAASSASGEDDNRPHRRRRDENTSGISVAELLKRTKK